jgi:hypothetical protein
MFAIAVSLLISLIYFYSEYKDNIIINNMNNSTNYFFDRALELLHRKTFDSYRVSQHNPYTIFDELERSIERYNKKRIKHFDPTVTSIIEEAQSSIKHKDLSLVFSFGSFTQNQIAELLKSCKDGKKNRTVSMISRTICFENREFKNVLLDKIKELLVADNDPEYQKIDLYTSWFISQLIFHGYSRKYIVDNL